MKIRTLLLFLVMSSVSATNAFSWGSEGHDVVVKMAIRLMKPAERKAVYDLLGTHNTHYIGHWADAVKDKNGTKNWHFVDIPDRDEHYNPERDCPNGDCIIAKLAMVQATIRNHSLSKQKRREALLYWFHLVGDLYQPFHCYGDKYGGNDIAVYFKGEPTNLHALWDDKVIWYKNSSSTTLAEEIFNAGHKVPAASTSFVDAAEKSHGLAVKYKLRNNTTIDADYVARSWATIQLCLWDAACMASTIGPDL